MTNEYFKEWTVIFPGRLGISWLLAWDATGTKEEAEAEANKHRNTVAVPLQLYKNLKHYEQEAMKCRPVEIHDKE